MHPTFITLSGTEYSEGSQFLGQIGPWARSGLGQDRDASLRYRYVQNDICKTEMHPCRSYLPIDFVH